VCLKILQRETEVLSQVVCKSQDKELMRARFCFGFALSSRAVYLIIQMRNPFSRLHNLRGARNQLASGNTKFAAFQSNYAIILQNPGMKLTTPERARAHYAFWALNI
jgi:hypothetical protein